MVLEYPIMTMLEIQKVRIVTNCHPGERVSKEEFGPRLATEFDRRGYRVELISMLDTYEEDGQLVPWYKVFARSGGFERRIREERVLISQEPDTLTILCHDWDRLLNREYDIYLDRKSGLESLYGFGPVILSELAAPLDETSDPEKLRIAEESSSWIGLRAGYLRFESRLDDPGVQERLKPSFINFVADQVEEMVEEGIPWQILSREGKIVGYLFPNLSG